jgi:hypothetical protein
MSTIVTLDTFLNWFATLCDIEADELEFVRDEPTVAQKRHLRGMANEAEARSTEDPTTSARKLRRGTGNEWEPPAHWKAEIVFPGRAA